MGCGLNSEEHVRVLAEEAPAGIHELERLGVPFSKSDDEKFIQLKAPSNSCPRACSVLGAGQNLMAVLGEQLKSHGVTLLEDAAAVRLFKQNDRVTGARIMSLSEPRAWNIDAKATVLASGGATGMFSTLSGDHRNTGDALILGYDAGAELANLEFTEFTLIFRVRETVLAIAGLAPFTSRGARMIDKDGAAVLERHYTAQEIENSRPGGKCCARWYTKRLRESLRSHSIAAIFSESVWAEFERSQGPAVLDKNQKRGMRLPQRAHRSVARRPFHPRRLGDRHQCGDTCRGPLGRRRMRDRHPWRGAPQR